MDPDLLCNTNICRLCGEENSEGTSIYDVTNFQTSIIKLINKYLPIRVSGEDGLPKVICPSCILQLHSTISFLEVIMHGQVKLRDLFLVQSASNVLSDDKTSNSPASLIKTELSERTDNDSDLFMSSCSQLSLCSDEFKGVSDQGSSSTNPLDTINSVSASQSVSKSSQNTLARCAPNPTTGLISDLNDDIRKIFSVPLDETPLYSNNHELSSTPTTVGQVVNDNIPPKKKRGRPRKDPNKITLPKPNVIKSEDSIGAELVKRKRKVPQRFLEGIRGVELEKILDEGEAEISEGLTNNNVISLAVDTSKSITLIDENGCEFELNENDPIIQTSGPVRNNDTVTMNDANITITVDPNQAETTENINQLKTVLKNHNKNETPKRKTKKHRKKRLYLYCEVCNKSFKSHLKLKMHRHTHNLLYRCSQCSKYYHIYKNLFEHQQSEVHKEYDVVDQNVQDPLPTEDNSIIEAYVNDVNGRLTCLHCNKEFFSKTAIVIHMKLNLNKERSYPCSMCNQSFELYSSLRNHIQTDHKIARLNSKTSACDICNKQFTHPSSVLYHKESVHSEKNYSCEKCDKVFKHKQLLNKHQLVHMETRPFQCVHCPMAFKTNISLNVHMMKHTGGKAHVCEMCNKVLTHRSSLISHYRWHQGVKPYQCLECNKSFNQKGNLKEHTRIHTGEKPFECAMCNKKFTTYSQHLSHTKRHTGEKPHTCEFCFKSFLSADSYKSHMRRHNGEKPYACTYENCSQTFVENGSLKKHLRTHYGVTPYTCDKCSKSFSDYSNFTKHKKYHETKESNSALLNIDPSLLDIIKKPNVTSLPSTSLNHNLITNEEPPRTAEIQVEDSNGTENVFYLYDDTTILPMDKNILVDEGTQDDVIQSQSFELVTDGSEIHLVRVPVDMSPSSESPQTQTAAVGVVTEQPEATIEQPINNDFPILSLNDNADNVANVANVIVQDKTSDIDTDGIPTEENYIEFVTEDGNHVRMLVGVAYNSFQFMSMESDPMEFT